MRKASCALEMGKTLKEHPDLPLRMGINSGPVNAVSDVNDRSNVAGTGINMAQRVMDCGDAGHILLSQRVANDLGQYSRWEPHLYDLGEVEVKHGVKSLSSISTPTKLATRSCQRSSSEHSRNMRRSRAAPSSPVAGTEYYWGLWFSFWPRRLRHSGFISRHARNVAPVPLASEVSIKSIAVLPFENLSADKENTYFASGIQDEIPMQLELRIRTSQPGARSRRP
jgi:Adenylate and Guanylate cyclase catalytic domain